MMPVMDGFATCREIRKNPVGQNLPILMLTSLEDDDSIRDAYDAGATDFFIKSTHWALLAERIRHLVRLSEIGRQLDRSNARLAKVHTAARAACHPIDDKRGTVAYRTKVAGVLARRAALIAYERART